MRHAALAALLLFALAGCGSDPVTVRGHLTLEDSSIDWLSGGVDGDGQPCQGMGGYDDIAEGATVVVRDSKGARVGLGALGAGEGVGDTGCRFAFKVPEVDSDSKILSVEITHRGEITFKRADAGAVEVSLG